MKRKRFTEEKIIQILKEAEGGVPLKDLMRKYGMSDASFYTWRAKFGGMEVSEAKRLRALRHRASPVGVNRKLPLLDALDLPPES